MTQEMTYEDRVQALARRVRKARGRLIERSMPLAKRAAKKFRHLPLDIEREAMVGLIRAVDTFDRSKGASFKTWVYRNVWWAIQDAARGNHAVYMPKDANTEYLAYRQAAEDLSQHYGAYPTEAEIAQEMGVPIERARKIAAYVPEVLGLGLDEEAPGYTVDEGEIAATSDEYVDVVPGSEPTQVSNLDYLAGAAEAVLSALPDTDAFILEASQGIDRRKSTRRRVAYITGLTEREVKSRLERLRSRLRKDPQVLALKEAAGYVTREEYLEEKERRLAHLPRHPSQGGWRGVIPRSPRAELDIDCSPGLKIRSGPSKVPAVPRGPVRRQRTGKAAVPINSPVLYVPREITEHERRYEKSRRIVRQMKIVGDIYSSGGSGLEGPRFFSAVNDHIDERKEVS